MCEWSLCQRVHLDVENRVCRRWMTNHDIYSMYTCVESLIMLLNKQNKRVQVQKVYMRDDNPRNRGGLPIE